jgi:hypothetical protein
MWKRRAQALASEAWSPMTAWRLKPMRPGPSLPRARAQTHAHTCPQAPRRPQPQSETNYGAATFTLAETATSKCAVPISPLAPCSAVTRTR